jgi:hypothetical protein
MTKGRGMPTAFRAGESLSAVADEGTTVPTEIRLQQFFISPEHQRSGIGTEVSNNLATTWKVMEKPIALTVLKNNPAQKAI